MDEIITISTAMRCLEKALDNLSALQNKDQTNLMKLIRASFVRHSLPSQMMEQEKATEELVEILNTINPQRICAAAAMDELGSWCKMIRNDITMAMAGIKLQEE